MFTPSGQPDLIGFGGVYGGGKGGGGGAAAPMAPRQPVVLTDPVDGTSFVDDSGGTGGQTGWVQVPGGGWHYVEPGSTAGYKSAQQQLNEHIAQRKEQEQATSATKAAEATQKSAADETAFQGSRQNAYDLALQSAMRSFSGQGVDPNQYMSQYIEPTLMRQFKSIQDKDPNPYASFPTSLGDTIVNQATGDRRTQLLNQLNSTFTPTYSSTALPDSLTGQYAGNIVNEQFDPLMDQLTNAQKRGTLTAPGYTAALDALNQKKSAAMSNVTNLGQGILNTDRSALDDYIKGARSDINAAGLGSNVDPSGYFGGAQSKAAGFTNDFGGALRNAVGGTKFADITELINAGGAVQGANNPTAANPMGGTPGTSPAFTSDEELATRKRGLGNAGAF